MNKKITDKDLQELAEKTNEEVVKDNVIAFKPDAKEPDNDWLWYLPIGTVFLAAPPPERDQYGRMMKSTGLMEFHVFDKKERGMNRAVKLLTNLNAEAFSWVDSRVFSASFKKHISLFEGNNKP